MEDSMMESLAAMKLMKEADDAITQCKLCRERGHEMPRCPFLAEYLRVKFRRKPGLSAGAIWATVWACVVVILVGSGLWRWLY